MKRGNFTFIFFGIFALIGIGLLCGGIAWLANGIEFKQTAIEVTAEVVHIESYRDSDGDRSYRPYVTYSVNGETYTDIPLHQYSGDMYVGQEVTLLCNPDHPEQTMITWAVYLGAGILMGIGAIFALIGILPIVLTVTKNLKQKKILQNGQILHATVDNIIWNTSLSVNGRHPYVIHCTYKDEYQDITYRFKSNNLWTDPSPVFPIGSYISVYVDPKNYSHYYVDAEQKIEEKIVDFT